MFCFKRCAYIPIALVNVFLLFISIDALAFRKEDRGRKGDEMGSIRAKRVHMMPADEPTAAATATTPPAPLDDSPSSKSSKGSKGSTASTGSYINPQKPYAKATNDVAFKHLLSISTGSDPAIVISLLNTFVPAFRDDPVASVKEQPVSLPSLKGHDKELQTFMDMHVISQRGVHYIIEMQARRHAMFDERVLYYACHTYADQLSEADQNDGSWFKLLNPVIALQFLDYDTNKARGIGKSDEERTLDTSFLKQVRAHPMPDDAYSKRYTLKDETSGQQIDHLQIIQVELPRVERKRPLFPPQQDFSEAEWWVSLFRHGNEYTNDVLDTWRSQMPKQIQQALDRLDLRIWAPKLQREYRLTCDDMELYGDTILAERAEAYTEGIKATALRLLNMNMDLDIISKATGLDEASIKQLEIDIQKSPAAL